MIKAILLVFKPSANWEKIALANKGFAKILLLFLLPVILISVGCELAGLTHLGRHHDLGLTMRVPGQRAYTYGAIETGLLILAVFVATEGVKGVAQTFHSRHTFVQCFTLVAYTLSPFFFMHLFDGLPDMNPWASFAIGIVLSVATLYHGVPSILDPDPPTAFGLYLSSAVILVGVMGLARFVTLLVLDGKVKFLLPST
jgi:hypothetical protein